MCHAALQIRTSIRAFVGDPQFLCDDTLSELFSICEPVVTCNKKVDEIISPLCSVKGLKNLVNGLLLNATESIHLHPARIHEITDCLPQDGSNH